MYLSLVLYCFELILPNAWHLHKAHVVKPLNLLEFCRRIACHFLETCSFAAELERKGRPSQNHKVNSRCDGKYHMIVKHEK